MGKKKVSSGHNSKQIPTPQKSQPTHRASGPSWSLSPSPIHINSHAAFQSKQETKQADSPHLASRGSRVDLKEQPPRSKEGFHSFNNQVTDNAPSSYKEKAIKAIWPQGFMLWGLREKKLLWFHPSPPSQRKLLALRYLAAVKGTSSAAVRGSSSPDGATSYANAVKGLVSAENGEKGLRGKTLTPMDFSYIKPVIENGRLKVMPPSEVAAVGCEEWKNTLIGYFVGQK